MQIRKQILDLLVRHDLVKTLHLGASILNDVSYALIIGGESAQRQVLMFEDAFETRTLFAVRRVRLVAAVTIVVIQLAASGLLRVEAEFGIGLAPLNVARDRHQDREYEHGGAEKHKNRLPEIHDEWHRP